MPTDEQKQAALKAAREFYGSEECNDPECACHSPAKRLASLLLREKAKARIEATNSMLRDILYTIEKSEGDLDMVLWKMRQIWPAMVEVEAEIARLKTEKS